MSTIPPALIINNRYEVLTTLGEGGMGTVYRAQDRLTGQIVAVKQMLLRRKNRDGSTHAASAMLAQEFKILASLRHPHIISVLDYGFDARGQAFYTMTFIESSRGFVPVAQEHD